MTAAQELFVTPGSLVGDIGGFLSMPIEHQGSKDDCL
jgi:hypothetical protein